VRVTNDEWQDQQRLGGKLAMRIRLYPPPTLVLAGVADYGRQARAQGVLASGYVISGLRPVADGGDRNVVISITNSINSFATQVWCICRRFPDFIWD